MPHARTAALILALACAPGCAPAATPAGGGHTWKTYTNVRYRYAICYPADLMKAQGEAPNSDGQTFDAPDGAELAVFGRNNVDNRSLAAVTASDADDMVGPGGRITYRATKEDWAVYSGVSKTSLVYSKTIRRGDQLLIFQLKYPQADNAQYQPVVNRISHCFTGTRR